MNNLVKCFVAATGYRRVFLLAAMAVISALLTQFFPVDPWKMLSITWFHGSELAPPVLPGIYFGAVLAVAACAWKKKNLFAAGIIIVGTAIAWVVAWECAFRTLSHLEQLRTSVAVPLTASGKPPSAFFVFAGIVGGFAGGFLTLAAISVAVPDFRTIGNWSRTLLVASLAGMLLAFDEKWLALFIVWQVGVAASIAYGWSFQETPAAASQPKL